MAFPNGSYINQIGDSAARAELEQFYSLLQGWLAAEHDEDGRHTDITADSIHVAGDVDLTGDLLTDDEVHAFEGSTRESGFVDPASVTGDVHTAAVRVGGTSGLFLQLRPAQSPYTTGNEIALWLLGFSTVKPILRFGSLGGTLTLLDGGSGSSLTIGSALDPMTAIVASEQGFFEGARGAAIGQWIANPFDAGNFTASLGVWTVGSGDVNVNRYMLVGKTLWWQLDLVTTTVSAGASLRATLPASLTCAVTNMPQLTRVSDAGAAAVPGLALVSTGLTYVEFRADVNGGNFSIATNTTVVQAILTIEVQ